MRIRSYQIILISCLFSLFISQMSVLTPLSYAQTPEATPVPPVEVIPPTPAAAPAAQTTAIPLEQNPPGLAEVTFAQLDQPTFELRSPVGQLSFNFTVPYRWAITGDSYIELHYDMQYEAQDPTVQMDAVNAAITVYFNDSLLTTFIPVEGINQTLRLVIPPEALDSSDRRQHRLRFVHLSGDCDGYFERSQFVVHDDSFIHLNYELLPLTINLADFPRPLVQNLFAPETILLIIPDDYSEADLAAAASVAATLGHRTFNTTLDIVTASEATPERLAQASIVVIGQPQQNSFLLGLYQRNLLPTTLTADGALIASSATQPISPEDGVLQEIVSEFSPDHVYLIVTGSSDTAITEAAHALSVLAPRYGFDGNLVVIADFQELDPADTASVDTFSLADLGFSDTTFYGLDTSGPSIRFFVPANWQLTEKPTLTLSYFHSGGLESSSSNLTISLNGKPIGGVPIDSGSIGERQAVIELPVADIKPGTRNRLSFDANLNVQLLGCSLPKIDSAWVRINESSQLRLPHVETEDTEVVASLEDPLTPFASRQDLSDVWFSLPDNLTQEDLRGMVQVAARLGNLSDGPGFSPHVSRGAISDTVELENYHVIAFGRPTNNPLIALVNEQLPQPFVANEDTLRQQVGNVVYHLPDGFSLGLLQALPAPWSPNKKVMLAVTGTTPEGVQWATDTLTSESTYYDLNGNLAFIRADRVETFDSAKFIRAPVGDAVAALTEDEPEQAVLEVVPTAVPPEPMPRSQAELPESYLPQGSAPPAVANLFTLGLIVAGLAVAAWGTFQNWHKAKTH